MFLFFWSGRGIPLDGRAGALRFQLPQAPDFSEKSAWCLEKNRELWRSACKRCLRFVWKFSELNYIKTQQKSFVFYIKATAYFPLNEMTRKTTDII
jgi:hypothetical protein